jgi:IS30 family transposase
VSREVKRHGGRSVYRASQADDLAWDSALRPKQCLLALHSKLREMAASELILDWSPEQISGWLKTEYPGDESMRVSHETIYRSLFIQVPAARRSPEADLANASDAKTPSQCLHRRPAAALRNRRRESTPQTARLLTTIILSRTLQRSQQRFQQMTCGETCGQLPLP